MVELSSGYQRPGKAAMLRAAVSVMGEHGYEGASMRDMASRAGVSAAAFYYHFPSKQDMLREFLEEAWQIALERIDRRLQLVSDRPMARLDELVATLIASQHHDEYAQLASVVALREHARLDPSARALIEQQHQRLRELVECILVAGIDTGDFTTAYPREAARAIIALTSPGAAPHPGPLQPMADVIEIVQRFARNIARS